MTIESQNSKISNKSKSVSESFSNNTSYRGSKRTKKTKKVNDGIAEASETLSMRLRSRSKSSKPVYNIETLLGNKSKTK